MSILAGPPQTKLSPAARQILLRLHSEGDAFLLQPCGSWLRQGEIHGGHWPSAWHLWKASASDKGHGRSRGQEDSFWLGDRGRGKLPGDWTLNLSTELSGVYSWQVAELLGLQAGQCPLGVDLIKGPVLAPRGTHVHTPSPSCTPAVCGPGQVLSMQPRTQHPDSSEWWSWYSTGIDRWWWWWFRHSVISDSLWPHGL